MNTKGHEWEAGGDGVKDASVAGGDAIFQLVNGW